MQGQRQLGPGLILDHQDGLAPRGGGPEASLISRSSPMRAGRGDKTLKIEPAPRRLSTWRAVPVPVDDVMASRSPSPVPFPAGLV